MDTSIKMIKDDILQCEWDPGVFMLFSQEVESFIYYSHLFPAIVSLIFIISLIVKGNLDTVSKSFIVVASLFSLFSLIDQSLWAIADPTQIVFLWSLLAYVEPLLYASVFYMIAAFVYKNKVLFRIKLLLFFLFLPVLLLGPTSFNIVAFDYTNCDRLAVEGPLLTQGAYLVEFIIILSILLITFLGYRTIANIKKRKILLLLTTGSVLFLFAFASGNIFGTLLQETMGEDAWVIGQFGLLSMPVFLGFILYLVANYKVFSIRLAAPVVLVFSLWVLVFSLLFVRNIEIIQVIVSITLLLLFIFGYALIKSVRKEISHREQIETLAKKLAKANGRLKELDKLKSEFVSIASHQLRSPLTAVSGYSSLLQEGAYGKLPAKAKEPIDRINKSVRMMAQSIEEYLNVSRIESGNMKYNLSDFNLSNQVETICDGLRAGSLRKGLVILCKRKLISRGVVNADIGKTQQVIYNLVDNATKYTKKGSVTVSVYDDKKKKKIFVEISDTGIGMSEQTLNTIFQKFERANNANSVNIKGTGLGLYVAQKMAEAMGGSIEAFSEGEGKGSRFVLELPLVM